MAVQHEPYRFSVKQYHLMAEQRVFPPDARVELIDGEIIQVAAIGSPHAACVDRLNRLFTAALGGGAIVRVQGPVVLSDWSEPEPDVSLLRPRADFYAAGHPKPPDIMLLIEVGETSVAFDERVKLRLYAGSGVAGSGISEVWIVDLPQGRIRVYREPIGGRYTQTNEFGVGASLSPAAFPDVALAVDDILP